MEHLPFVLFALLPFGLLSWRRLPRSTACFLPLLAALAPVIAKGIGSLINHKQAGSAQKQAEEQKRLEAQQADTLARQSWEAEQNSPGAQAARYKSTLQLGRLAGKMGGLDKLPPSMRNYYQSQRTMPTYGGTSSYVPTPKKGGGASAGLKAAGNTAAQAGGLGALQGGGVATTLTDLTQRLKG